MRTPFERLTSLVAIGLVFVLMLPSAGFADVEQHAALWPTAAIGLKVDDGVVTDCDSESSQVRQMVAFEDVQTVIKPSVRRWWQKTSRVVAIVVVVAVAAFIVAYGVGGGGQ